MRLPILQSTDVVMQLIQSKWSSIINPLIENVSNQASIISNITLAVGDNTINHLLGKKLQGYRIILKNANANIYDKQETNQSPEKTLVLNSSAIVTISLEVF